MSRTIAEVLAEHQQSTGHRDMKVHCWCGWAANRMDGAFIAHQAAALSAAGFGDVREAAAAGVYALDNAWGSNGRATIKSREAINVARQMLDGEWDSLIKCEMELHPRRIRSRAATMKSTK